MTPGCLSKLLLKRLCFWVPFLWAAVFLVNLVLLWFEVVESHVTIEKPLVAQYFLDYAWYFVISNDCSSQVEGQAGFGFRVTAVD